MSDLVGNLFLKRCLDGFPKFQNIVTGKVRDPTGHKNLCNACRNVNTIDLKNPASVKHKNNKKKFQS